MKWRLHLSNAQRTSTEDKTGIQEGLVNLKKGTKSTRPGSAFQSPVPKEDKGQAGVKNGE